MMIEQVIIVAGGDPDLWPKTQFSQKPHKVWIGVDRGAHYLLERGIVPQIAIGDFDSLSPTELSHVESQVATIRYLVPEKDDTDTQLAIQLALEDYPKAEILVMGATGGRLDHFLANLWMPLEPRFTPEMGRIKLVDKQNTITYYLPGSYLLEKEKDKNYLAYVGLTPVTDLTLRDAKYSLINHSTDRPQSFASNEFVGQHAHFSFTTGVVAVIQSTD